MTYALQIDTVKLAEIAANITSVLTDHDDCLYELDADMHAVTMPSIARTFNMMTHTHYAHTLKQRAAELFSENGIAVKDINNLDAQEGGACFNAILQAI